MKPNMGTAFSGTDAPRTSTTLKTSLALLVANEPPAATYAQWDGFLQQALAAAKAKRQERREGHRARAATTRTRTAYKTDTDVPTTPPCLH